MAKVPLGIVVVGLGWGERKCRLVAECPETRLLGVVDCDEQRGRRIASEYDVPWWSEIDQALAEPDLDTVGIYTPSGTHGELIERALTAGKHVFCTKPLEITSDRIDKIAARAEECGLIVAVDHDRRYRPSVARLKELVDLGRMGRLVQGHFAFRAHRGKEYWEKGGGWRGQRALTGGGVMINQTLHLIDLALWLMGRPERVYATASTMCADIEVEDSANALLSFSAGACASVAGTTCFRTGPLPPTAEERARPQGSVDHVELCGSEGAVFLERGEPRRWIFSHPGCEPWQTMPTGRPMNIVDDITAAIRDGASPAVGPREARESVEIVEAMYESIRTGAVVDMRGRKDTDGYNEL